MRTFKRHTIGILALAAMSGAIGCSAMVGEEPGQTSESLRRAASCTDLLDMIRKDAIAKVDQQADEAIAQGPDYYGGPWADDGSFADGGGMPTSGSGGGGGGGSLGAPEASPPSGYSDTNTQVAGVDEADIVKTDGQHIWLLHGSELEVVQSWPPQSSSVKSSISIEGSPTEMFVHEGKAVVFSYTASGGDCAAFDGPSDGGDWGCYESAPYEELTKLTVIDLLDDGPQVIREAYIEGSYRSSRRHGMTVRAVVDGGFAAPVETYPDFWDYGYQTEVQPGSIVAKIGWTGRVNRWRKKAIEAIGAQPLEDWLPVRKEMVNGELVELPPSCTDFFVPGAAAAGNGITNVVALDLAAPSAPIAGASVLGFTDEVYANHEVLVLAHTEYGSGWPQTREQTALHRFELNEKTIAYAGSGTVSGHLHDQFSIDEQKGVLRVSTTENVPVGDWDSTTMNRVVTLAGQNGRLEVVGDTGPLAEGETIYSTRFVGDKGYVVTFRQVDPLFVIDLSRPERPVVLGELKIPGFSDYMQPLGENHLLTIGRDVDEEGWGPNALALQIFDVSNPTAPRLAHKHVFDKEGYSEANDNHKAFNFYADKGLLAFPFYGWERSGGYTSTLEVFRVGAETGFAHVGSVDHAPLMSTSNMCGDEWSGYYYCGDYSPEVRRGLFIDDFVYSISYGGVLVHSTSDLTTPVATVDLPDPSWQ